MSRKYTLEDIRRILSEKGYELLSDTYTSAMSPISIQCSCGHIIKISLSNWKKRGCTRCNQLEIEKLKQEEIQRATLDLVSHGFDVVVCPDQISLPFTLRCQQGHQFSKKYWYVVNDTYKCMECEKEKRWDESKIRCVIEQEGYTIESIRVRGVNTSISVVCPEGHHFTIKFKSWLEGKRCRRCKGVLVNLTIGEVRKYIESEGYRLLSNNFNGIQSMLEVECPEGHRYKVSWSNWWHNKRRCRKCFGTVKPEIEYISKTLEKEGYKLLSTEYVNAKSNLEMICPDGHIFTQQWNTWRNGSRCPTCFGTPKIDFGWLKDRFMEKGITVMSSHYEVSQSKLDVVCEKGHKFKYSWADFRRNGACPFCNFGSSKMERDIKEYVESLGFEAEANNRRVIHPLEIDVFIPEIMVGIETCGLYWHSQLAGEKDYKYHFNKLEKCEAVGIRLITIFEDEYCNNKPLVYKRIAHILNKNYGEKIYARKCLVSRIDADTANKFVEENHLQGVGQANIHLGAFYNGTLVAVMTFSSNLTVRNIQNRPGLWELNRFCGSQDKVVVGIASKMLAYFERCYVWNTILSFADRRWSEGRVYSSLGFELLKKTKPDYWYLIKYRKRLHRSNLQKDENDDPSLSEWENRQLQGYDRIWDCGSIKFVKYNTKEVI